MVSLPPDRSHVFSGSTSSVDNDDADRLWFNDSEYRDWPPIVGLLRYNYPGMLDTDGGQTVCAV